MTTELNINAAIRKLTEIDNCLYNQLIITEEDIQKLDILHQKITKLCNKYIYEYFIKYPLNSQHVREQKYQQISKYENDDKVVNIK